MRWILPLAIAAVSVGCDNRYSGDSGELKKIQNENREYLLTWEKPVAEKSDSILVKLKCKIAGIVKNEFVVASYDKAGMPEFKMEYDKSSNKVKIVDAFGSKFEFTCE